MSRRKAQREITIAADVDTVWKALTEADQISSWFAPDVRVKPGPGGEIWMSWGPGFDGATQIVEWEPGRRLATANDKRPVAVDYEIEGRGGTTLVRVVQSMPDTPDWDDEFNSSGRGWEIFLRVLKDYLERRRGMRCRQAQVMLPVTLPLDDAWARVTGPRGLAVDGGAPGVHIWQPPSALQLDLGEDACAYVTLECMAQSAFLFAVAYLYGERADQAPALQQEWQQKLTAALS